MSSGGLTTIFAAFRQLIGRLIIAPQVNKISVGVGLEKRYLPGRVYELCDKRLEVHLPEKYMRLF